jgi:hypothetical protein
MAEEIKVPKFQQFEGSPDIFETATGKVVTEADAQSAGLFTPEGLSADVQKVSSPRPGVKTEADFARFSGLNIGDEPNLPLDTDTTGGGVISDTSDPRAAVDKTKTDIEAGLAEIGITPPDDTVSPVVADILKGLKDRQAEMDKRRAEDVANIKSQYDTAIEEQDISQEEALAKAEGRTRIGGFITKMEIDDIQALERKFRLEDAALLGQKTTAIQTAQRAYDDQDFKLAQAQLELAQNIEKQSYEKKQDYFNNVLKMQGYYEKLNKPVAQLEEFETEQILTWMTERPEAFTDLKPSDLAFGGGLTYGEAQARWLDAGGAKAKVSDLLTPTEAARLGLPYGTTKTQAAGLGIVPKFGGGDGDEDEVSNVESFAIDLAAGSITAANVPQDIRGKVLTRAREVSKENLFAQVDTYPDRESALTDLENNKDGIIVKVGADGFNEIKQEINTRFPEEEEEEGGGIAGTVGSFFKRLFSF